MMLVPTCVCGHPQGKNHGDCERCSMLHYIMGPNKKKAIIEAAEAVKAGLDLEES